MPLLPTLFTVVVLAAASMVCTKSDAPAPSATARMIPAGGGASLAISAPLAMTDPSEPALAPSPAPRPPAVIAFSEAFPLAADPATTSALPAAPAPTRAVSVARPSRRLASTGRRPCAGKRCQDNPAAGNPAQESPFQAARAASEEPASGPSIPSALPFAESVVEAVVPVAREVGAGIGTRVERITGRAGEWVQGGQAVVKGSVSVLTDRLF